MAKSTVKNLSSLQPYFRLSNAEESQRLFLYPVTVRLLALRTLIAVPRMRDGDGDGPPGAEVSSSTRRDRPAEKGFSVAIFGYLEMFPLLIFVPWQYSRGP